jgi:hypothetical protein
LECGSRSCRFRMPQAAREHTKAATAVAALQNAAVLDVRMEPLCPARSARERGGGTLRLRSVQATAGPAGETPAFRLRTTRTASGSVVASASEPCRPSRRSLTRSVIATNGTLASRRLARWRLAAAACPSPCMCISRLYARFRSGYPLSFDVQHFRPSAMPKFEGSRTESSISRIYSSISRADSSISRADSSISRIYSSISRFYSSFSRDRLIDQSVLLNVQSPSTHRSVGFTDRSVAIDSSISRFY